MLVAKTKMMAAALLVASVVVAGAGAEEDKDAPLRLSASGSVVDDKGKPIAGATVYLRVRTELQPPAERLRKGYAEILAQMTTDVSGRFAFQDVAADADIHSSSITYRNPWNIVVTAKGCAIAWHNFQSRDEQNLKFVMQPEAHLRGRLIDAQGKPAVGVRVWIGEVDDRLDPMVRLSEGSEDRLVLYWTTLPLTSITDSDGRFVMAGLPRKHSVGMWISDPRFARKWLQCATVDEAEINRLNATPSLPPEYQMLPDGFTCQGALKTSQ